MKEETNNVGGWIFRIVMWWASLASIYWFGGFEHAVIWGLAILMTKPH